MTPDIALVFALVVVSLVLFAWERFIQAGDLLRVLGTLLIPVVFPF